MVNWDFVAKIIIYVAALAMVAAGISCLFIPSPNVFITIVQGVYYVYGIDIMGSGFGVLFFSAQFGISWYKQYFGFLEDFLGKSLFCVLYVTFSLDSVGVLCVNQGFSDTSWLFVALAIGLAVLAVYFFVHWILLGKKVLSISFIYS